MGRLQTSFPAQLYLISRVSGLYGKEHVCRVLHAPRNVTLLTTVRGVKPDKTWLEPFQVLPAKPYCDLRYVGVWFS